MSSRRKIVPRYKINQLAACCGEFGVITGVMDRGGVFAYEINGSMTAEENIDKVYSEIVITRLDRNTTRAASLKKTKTKTKKTTDSESV